MIQVRLDELRQERTNAEEERRSLQRKNEDQWKRLSEAEGELARWTVEAEAQKAEIARLQSTLTSEVSNSKKDNEVLKQREAELQNEVAQLRQKIEEKQREAELRLVRLDSEKHQEALAGQTKVAQLEAEVSLKANQARAAEKAHAELEVEKEALLRNEEDLRWSSVEELRRSQEALDEAQNR